jgi:transposase
MARSDMSDLEWRFIKQVLPNKSRGVKRVDDRRVINGIFYVLRTGIPWADPTFTMLIWSWWTARPSAPTTPPPRSKKRRCHINFSKLNYRSF